MTSRLLVALRVAATVERAFEVFTREIELWWRPNRLFQFTPGRSGRLAFEPELGGRLIEIYDDGEEFEIGKIKVWEPPARLVFSWRQASFRLDQQTEVHVSFKAAGDETRVTVEHFGWDGIPLEHAARHSFPLNAFQQRYAEWWRLLLESLNSRL